MVLFQVVVGVVEVAHLLPSLELYSSTRVQRSPLTTINEQLLFLQ